MPKFSAQIEAEFSLPKFGENFDDKAVNNLELDKELKEKLNDFMKS